MLPVDHVDSELSNRKYSVFRKRIGPSGAHFFDRQTGLNILFDEAEMPQEKWAKAPRQVAIALTNACDLSCAHCYAPKQAAALVTERVCSWLSELDINGCLGVGFGGGEPTLHRGFPKLCRYTAQHTEMAVTFTTHGHHFLNENLSAAIAGHVHFIRVSMDGVGQTYEAIRGRTFDCFLRALRVISTLAPFGLNYVVNRHTLPDLNEATRVGADAGATELLLLPEIPVRGKGGIDSITQTALAEWVSSYSGPLRLSVSVHGADGLPICDPLPRETGLRAYAHIDATGFLRATSYDPHGISIGNGTLMQALNMLITHQRKQQ